MTQENTSAIENQNPSAQVAEGTEKVVAKAAETQEQPPEDFLQTDETVKKESISESEKGLAAAGYLPFTCLIPLVLSYMLCHRSGGHF